MGRKQKNCPSVCGRITFCMKTWRKNKRLLSPSFFVSKSKPGGGVMRNLVRVCGGSVSVCK